MSSSQHSQLIVSSPLCEAFMRCSQRPYMWVTEVPELQTLYQPAASSDLESD